MTSFVNGSDMNNAEKARMQTLQSGTTPAIKKPHRILGTYWALLPKITKRIISWLPVLGGRDVPEQSKCSAGAVKMQ